VLLYSAVSEGTQEEVALVSAFVEGLGVVDCFLERLKGYIASLDKEGLQKTLSQVCITDQLVVTPCYRVRETICRYCLI
jgi:hypothetical protein